MRKKIQIREGDDLSHLSRSDQYRSIKRGFYYEKGSDKYNVKDVASNKDLQRFNEIVGLEYLNKTYFYIRPSFIEDMRKGNTHLSKSDWIEFKSVVVRLRNEIRKFLNHPSEDSLRRLLKDRRIKKHIVFDKKMIDRASRGLSIYEHEIEKARIEYAKIYNLLLLREG